MPIVYKTGDILNSDADVICHQVNCRGAMNSGVAKAIRQKYPIVYTKYAEAAEDIDIGFGDKNLSWEHMLGHIQDVYTDDNRCIINMFAQNGYGYDGKRYTSYDAFWNCLQEIKNIVPKESKIAFPARIGSVRGGANWPVIQMMITVTFDTDYWVEIWDYDKG